MATDQSFALYIEDQLRSLSDIRLKKMFGEYGIFYREKMVGLICDNNLFIKPTDTGLSYLKSPEYGSPYPNAKPHFLIESTDDIHMLRDLILITYDALPIPKPKKKAK